MNIAGLILVAIMVFGLRCVGATTVEQYQLAKSKPDSPDAVLNATYIKGLGAGIEVANTSMFFQTVVVKTGSSDRPESLQLYCPPPNLLPETTNFMSVLDGEIKRRLDLAVDPTERQKVMQTSISIILRDGMVNAFPCTSDNIKESIEALLQSLESKKK